MYLSFVVPAYNEELYLAECLESILDEIRRQTASQYPQDSQSPDFEVTVVNNASTDRTREVALRYPGVRVVDEPRKGLPAARQAGFDASSGKLIANVDADSRLPAGWIRNILATFEAEPDLVALSGPVLYYDLLPHQRALVQFFYLTAFVTYAVNRWVLRVGSMIQGGNFVVSRAGIEAIGGFNLSISFYGEDTDLARRLNNVGEVRFSLGMKMLTSGRRLKQEGLLTMAARYSINYLWTTFLKRPYSQTHIDVREQREG